MKAGSHFEKILERKLFAVTAELCPPKGNDLNAVKRKADLLRGAADAVNVTDNQTAIVRMSSLSASVLVSQLGMEPVMQMVTRDRNRIAMQSDILGATALGIRNMLCLTGDHQSLGNQAGAKNVHDLDSIQLIDCVRAMRDRGVLLGGEEKVEGAVRIFIGAASNPSADPLDFHVIRLSKKIKAGADFVQTSCVYDMGRFKEWMKRVCDRGLHEKVCILAGVFPLTSGGMSRQMNKHFPGVTVPDDMIERMDKARNPEEEGIKICVEQVEELKTIPGVRGIHIMTMGREERVRQVTEMTGLLPRPKVE
jgi:methylenetetrahydrofolate reductase (NADPH)